MAAREVQARLKAACYDYYTTQQQLGRAEDEHLQLRSIVAQLEERVANKRQEVAAANDARREIDEEREKEAELPAGVPVAAFDAFVNEERRLLAEAAKAEDEFKLLEEECEQLERHVVTEGKSARVLEDALDAQVQFSEVLRGTCASGSSRIDAEHQRQSTVHAKGVMLAREHEALRKRENLLQKKVRAMNHERTRAQRLLQDRDSDVMRLRRDAAFSRRLYMGELEHAREQEAQLQRLVTENRRLRAMIESRRDGRPSMAPRRDVDADGTAEDNGFGAEVIAGGRRARVTIESNDEAENIAAREADPKQNARRKADALEKAKERNLALLQQMVSTMQALRVTVAPVAGA